MTIETDKTYYYKQTFQEEIFEAIVKLTYIDPEYDKIRGDAIFVMNNSLGWEHQGLALQKYSIIKEMSKEADPEYFL